MELCVVKIPPYNVFVDGRKFSLKEGKSIYCTVIGPKRGIVEFAVDGIDIEEWYEASEIDGEQLDVELERHISSLVEDYMLEEDSKLAARALELKSVLLDLFKQDEGDCT